MNMKREVEDTPTPVVRTIHGPAEVARPSTGESSGTPPSSSPEAMHVGFSTPIRENWGRDCLDVSGEAEGDGPCAARRRALLDELGPAFRAPRVRELLANADEAFISLLRQASGHDRELFVRALLARDGEEEWGLLATSEPPLAAAPDVPRHMPRERDTMPPPPPPSSQPVVAELPRVPLTRAQMEVVLGRVFQRLDRGNAGPDTFETLADVTRQEDGVLRVGDALEAVVCQEDDGRRMRGILDQAAASSRSAIALVEALSRMAALEGRRTVGTLLLTSDGPGGPAALVRLLARAAQTRQGAGRVAELVSNAARDPEAASGLIELLEVLTEARHGGYERSHRLARTLAQAGDSVEGARRLNEGLEGLLAASGGGRALAMLLSRFTATRQGAVATSDLLEHLSSDREGASILARVLERATTSGPASRDAAGALERMARLPTGARSVSLLLQRLSLTEAGARLLSNLAADPTSARTLACLIDRALDDHLARARWTRTLGNLPRHAARADAQAVRARIEWSASLRAAVLRLWSEPPEPLPEPLPGRAPKSVS